MGNQVYYTRSLSIYGMNTPLSMSEDPHSLQAVWLFPLKVYEGQGQTMCIRMNQYWYTKLPF